MLFYFCGGLCFSAQAQTIPELHEQEKALDRQIRETLVLAADPQQPQLGGMNKKFLARDQLGRRWMFKMHRETILDAIEGVALDVGHFLGIPLPQIYLMTLTVNGKPSQGTLHQWLEPAVDLQKIAAASLTAPQINALLRHQIYDTLIANYDVQPENFLLLKNTGEIVGIDKDFAFDRYGEAIPLLLKPTPQWLYAENYYMEVWKNYLQKKAEVDFGPLLEMLAYVRACDEAFLETLVKPAFELEYVRKHLGGLQGFMERKRQLADDFLALYGEAEKERGETAASLPLPEASIYANKVRAAYLERIEAKQKELTQLSAAKKGEQQPIQVKVQARPDSGVEILTPSKMKKIILQPQKQPQS